MLPVRAHNDPVQTQPAIWTWNTVPPTSISLTEIGKDCHS